MSIEGRIAIDVNFADSSDATGVQSLKKISLVDTSSYSSGKVAVVTGTIGVSGTSINCASGLTYRDASGQVVQFSNVSRLAFQCSRDCTASDEDDTYSRARSNGNAAVCDWKPAGQTITLEPQFTSGTASYTLVLYGT